MPVTNTLRFRIGNRDIEVEDINAVPLALDYALEDPEDFEKKQSSRAFDVVLPATQNNSQTFNSPSNPDAEDLTADSFFSSHHPCVIEANGVELLRGKAFLVEATHTNRPEKIKINCYGNNADWLIDLKEMTLADFMNPATHLFHPLTMQGTWGSFTGNSELNDFVYAPVRYAKSFKDNTVTHEDLKPAISMYWILWRAFKSLGYRIESTFLDSTFFRRQVMPWTWGDFLFTDDILQKPYLFRRVCTRQEWVQLFGGAYFDYISAPGNPARNTSIAWADADSQTAQNQVGGGFEGTDSISAWSPPTDLTYAYPADSVLGYITAGFELQMYYYIYISSGSNDLDLNAEWYINGSLHSTDLVYGYSGSGVQEGTAVHLKELNLNPGDVVTLKLKIVAGDSGSHAWNWRFGNTYTLSQTNSEPPSHLELKYFKKAIGSPVNLTTYPVFKKYKFLDFLCGLVDDYDLSIQTNPVTKTVYIEPTHPYGQGNNRTQGYLGKGTLDWTRKQDLEKESVVQLYSEGERAFDFKFKGDSTDGGIAILQKRSTAEIGASRYLFPDRFKAGKKTFTNRFFSPVVHAPVREWKDITGTIPQLITLIPEDTSTTSAIGSGEPAFEPKFAYYKGVVAGVGGWKWKPTPAAATVTYASLPFLFAVNYQPGGDADPVLTYGDQRIETSTPGVFVAAPGLMRRHYLPRLAIMRHGRLYKSWFKLDMRDVTNWLHREAIAINGNRYFLIEINKFLPLHDETTSTTMWQWAPISVKDDAACFPSSDSVLATGTALGSFDLAYTRSMLLSTDLPTTTTDD